MNTHGRRGRPSKPYQPSWGGPPISGLRRERDGRWRIVATRDTFTEPDERLAVQRFRAWQDRQANATVPMRHDAFDSLDELAKALSRSDARLSITTVTTTDGNPVGLPQGAVDLHAPSGVFWSTVRRLLIDKPQLCADMTGLPSLVTWNQYNAPSKPIKLSHLKDLYVQRSHAKQQSRNEAGNTFQAFMDFTKAETLDDLTTGRLVAYREHVKAKASVDSPGTIAAYFGRVKNIVKFGKSEGEDTAQIDAALSRMAVLKAPPDGRTHQPTPISREDFHAIYAKAGELLPDWQPRLLLMLNCCLHFDECLDLEWADFNLDAGTFCTKRNKRGRVIRAATLWPETVAALKAIRRTGSPYVFVSNRGTRFHNSGQWKSWDKIRREAGLADVQLDDIRDGAYTAACNAAGVEEKFARLLAGQRSHGLQDNYVQRNPAVVAPASEAVYRTYFGAK